MQSQEVRDRRRRQRTILLGLILAVIATAATYYVLTQRGGDGTANPSFGLRDIVVAAVDIPARSQITETMLRTVQVPDDPVLANADTDIAAAVGKVAVVEIKQGQAVSSNLYSSGSAGGGPNASPLAIIPPEETVSPDSPVWRAVSVSIPRDRAVGGLLTVGDHVDLFVTLEIKLYDSTGQLSETVLPGGYIPGTSTKITWTNLEVLAVDPESSLYVFRVTGQQAEEIAHVQGSGGNSFSLSLRAAADDREIDPEALGQTTNTIIDFYGFPIPQIIFLPAGGFTPAPAPTGSPEPAPESPAPPESPAASP